MDPELDHDEAGNGVWSIARGSSIIGKPPSARTNLIEALELLFESADPTETTRRLHSEVLVTRVRSGQWALSNTLPAGGTSLRVRGLGRVSAW